MFPAPESDLPLALPTAGPTADLVARHATFVRALAQRLCRCDADADDLAQDTWVEALRRPPGAWTAPEERPEGWLVRVAQRLAGRRERGERRRSVRETTVARDARELAAPGTSLDHALVLRDVVDALVALDEDARRIVVARHFEGLELAALAAREGVATSTLKLRLAAAYERLRARLDDRAGGDRARWTRALLVATGGAPLTPPVTHAPSTPRSPGARPESPTHLTLPPRAASLVTSAAALRTLLVPAAAHLSSVQLFAMGLAFKVTAVAVVGALVATGLALRGGERGAAALTPTSSGAALVPTDVAALDAVSPRAERTATPRATDSAPEAPAPVDTRELSALATVEVLVTDLDGVPAANVEVLAAPWDAPLNRVGRTDERGALTLRWRPGYGDPRVLVALRSRGSFLGGLRVLDVPPGSVRALRVALDPALLPSAGGPTSRIVLTAKMDGSRLSAKPRVVEAYDALGVAMGSYEVAKLSRLADEAEGEVQRELRRGPLEADAERLAEGEVAFVAGSSEVLESVDVGARIEYLRYTSKLLEARVSTVGIMLDQGQDAPALVRGVVRDIAGLPAASARVTARRLGVDDAVPVTVVTDREGRYELRAPIGRTAIIAGTGPNPGSRTELELIQGDERTCDLTLDRGLALVGVAKSGEAPVAGAHVEATVTRGDERWLAIAVSDAEGRFVVPHCAAPSVDLDVFVPESEVPVPLATYAGVFAGMAPFGAQLDAAPTPRLVVPLRDGDPGAVAVGALRVHDDRGARVAQVPVRGAVGTPLELKLPYGFWWVSASAHGPHQGAPRRVELHRPPPDAPLSPTAEQPLDVGPTAAIALPAPPEGATWRVVRLLDGRVPCAVATSVAAAPAEDLEVPPGVYRVLALDAEGDLVRSVELTLKVGERAAL
jgi:RNA polymerase sigma factor (sigma-70 family)